MKRKPLIIKSDQPPAKERLFFLDVLKAISIIAVVSYHSIFVPKSTYETSFFGIDTLFASWRFCVPVLLTISFLLSERSLSKQQPEAIWVLIKKRLIRLAIPTVFWFSIAAILKLINHNSPINILQEMSRGEIFHGAYYLLIMFQLTLVFVWLRQWLKRPRILALSILLQCLVFLAIALLLIEPAKNVVISALREIHRPLVIYWFGYISLGIVCYHYLPAIRKQSSQMSTRLKGFLLAVMALLLMGEYGWLGILTKSSIPPFDYLMFSCLLSVPIMFICFAAIDEFHLCQPIRRAVILLSKYSLGVFCINGILSQVFLSFGSRWFSGMTFSFPEILALKLIGWSLLLPISLVTAIALSRVGLKAVVS